MQITFHSAESQAKIVLKLYQDCLKVSDSYLCQVIADVFPFWYCASTCPFYFHKNKLWRNSIWTLKLIICRVHNVECENSNVTPTAVPLQKEALNTLVKCVFYFKIHYSLFMMFWEGMRLHNWYPAEFSGIKTMWWGEWEVRCRGESTQGLLISLLYFSNFFSLAQFFFSLTIHKMIYSSYNDGKCFQHTWGSFLLWAWFDGTYYCLSAHVGYFWDPHFFRQ